jgi:2'-5' RNA ligase
MGNTMMKMKKVDLLPFQKHAATRKTVGRLPPNGPPAQLSLGEEFDGGPTRRLFLGIRADGGAISGLTRLMAELCSDGIMPGRPVDPDRLHITLHHLSDFADQIPSSLIPAVNVAMATVKMQPFEVVCDRVGGTRGPFLLRASDGSPALKIFRQTLSAALIEAGLRRYVDPVFNPHVTLSYDFSDTPEHIIEPISWTVRQFVLIESLLGQHRHIVRGCWSIRD